MRIEKNGTRYQSLEELRKAWGMQPYLMRTNNQEKLNSQRERFYNKHKCRACGKPMTWTGGNIMCCQNAGCRGVKHERETKEGKIVEYLPSFDILDDVGANIARNILD